MALLLGLLLFWGEAARAQEDGKYYNIKAGPFRFILTAGMQAEFNDNINLSNGIGSPVQSDIILHPYFSVDAISELQIFPKTQTDVTTLGVRFTLGTRRYLRHSELNQDDPILTIAPDSELSFLVRTGHFRTRIYDQFSLEDDPNADGTLSNVAVFRRFRNAAGFQTDWDINSKTRASWGYEHGNLWVLNYETLSGTAPNLNALDSSSDGFSVSCFSQIFPALGVGARASASSTSYPDSPGQNSTSYQYGPFANLRITEYTSLDAFYGRSYNKPGSLLYGGGDNVWGTSDSHEDVYSLSLYNRFNRHYTQTLTASRQTQFNILGALSVVDRIAHDSAWRVNSKITLRSVLFAEDVTDLGGGLTANPHYRRYGWSLGTGYRLSRKMYTSIDYQYSKKVSDAADQSYQQNLFIWSLNYAF